MSERRNRRSGVSNERLWEKLVQIETLLRAVLKEREPVLPPRVVNLDDVIVKDAFRDRIEQTIERERAHGRK